jgi:membrane glycosyltransferase
MPKVGPDLNRDEAAETRPARKRNAGGRLRARRRRRFRPVVKAPVVARAIAPEPPARPDPALRSTPLPAPLETPVQDLKARPAADGPEPQPSLALTRNRLILMLGACAFAAIDGFILTRVLGADGRITGWEALTILLSILLGVWLAFGCISATAGFVASFGERGVRPRLRALPLGRTAILLPTYNEDPGLILAAVESMAEALHPAGLAAACDFFVLSDTRDPAIARAEATGILRLRARLPDGPQVYYRRRAQNTDKKAGNIGEWVETWGGAYDYMLVLDADSLMSGETIAELIARMDADPTLGLLQTAPSIINAVTPFARIQQFANRLYGPLFARGQQWWSGSEGNYWGHNAIIRVQAFAACARLPHLPGSRPFGGHIMSHDFVEAALLRRAGWAVRMITSLPGSYEESPPTLLDSAARDRRWCQGNLQHARILFARGLHWVSRLHLACGIMAYLTPVLWLALLAAGSLVWPEQHIRAGSAEFRQIIGLFVASLALLGAPKVMALVLALRAPDLRRGFGGASRLVLGVLLESAASMLTTPVTMVMQSVAVLDVLIGRDSGWSAQHREGTELCGRDAWRAHGGHVLLGLLGAVGAFFVSKDVLLWTSPVFLSLALSAVLSLHSSRPLPQGEAGDRRLLQTPEDADPPAVLVRAAELRRAYAAEAGLRRQIEAHLRGPVAVYDGATRRAVPLLKPLALVA